MAGWRPRSEHRSAAGASLWQLLLVGGLAGVGLVAAFTGFGGPIAGAWRGVVQLATPPPAVPETAGTIVGRASVIDGDTIEIRGTRIRFSGIDAPESRQYLQRSRRQRPIRAGGAPPSRWRTRSARVTSPARWRVMTATADRSRPAGLAAWTSMAGSFHLAGRSPTGSIPPRMSAPRRRPRRRRPASGRDNSPRHGSGAPTRGRQNRGTCRWRVPPSSRAAGSRAMSAGAASASITCLVRSTTRGP